MKFLILLSRLILALSALAFFMLWPSYAYFNRPESCIAKGVSMLISLVGSTWAAIVIGGVAVGLWCLFIKLASYDKIDARGEEG